jgi:hypothetical protein
LKLFIVAQVSINVPHERNMRQTGMSETCVWRWQERFMEEGVDGLFRDKTRPSRVRRLGQDVAERIVALTQQDPPCEATHWTGVMVAKTVGVSVNSVQRIWRATPVSCDELRSRDPIEEDLFAQSALDLPASIRPIGVEQPPGPQRVARDELESRKDRLHRT